MSRSPVIAGVALIVIGGVWIFQGIGSLKGSFMTGSPFWAWVGGACVVLGAALLIRAAVGRRR